MRFLVIVNPVAGGTGRTVETVREALGPVGGDLVATRAAGEAVDLATRAARDGIEAVIAAGGDGTVREVATGLYRGGGGPRLGILPMGTGNDLARALGVPDDPGRALDAALRGRSAPLDLIRVTGPGPDDGETYLVNAAVTGFCGRIADGMGLAIRRWLRPMAYPLAALSQLRDLGPYDMRLRVDEREVMARVLMLIVANGPFAGGNLRLAPDADPSDGRLEVVLIHAVPWARLIGLVPRVLAGRHISHAGVSTYRAGRVQVESRPPAWTNVDGDTWRAGSIEFSVLPAALRVAVP